MATIEMKPMPTVVMEFGGYDTEIIIRRGKFPSFFCLFKIYAGTGVGG